MPRRPRQVSSTGMYHVVIKGVNHEAIFEKTWQKKYLLKLLDEKREKYEVNVYCYCIMSTHLHLILQGEIKNISRCESELASTYAIVYNREMKRNGHLFQERYYSGVIETENAFWNCVNYIHNNPVKAHMVDKPATYRYSSYNEFAQENAKYITGKSIKMMNARFASMEEFRDFSQKNRQETWFYGTNEEMKQQKEELIEQALNECRDQLQVLTQNQKLSNKGYIDKIAEELNVPKRWVEKCARERKGTGVGQVGDGG